MIGVTLDVIFRFQIFSNPVFTWIGVIFLIFSTFLILWAQKASRKLNKGNMSDDTFRRGPYRYTRNPTHLGIVSLILGFGIIANAVFIVLTTLISFLINKFVFLKKEEAVLTEKYGAPYLEYKKSVKF
jgi:protein-S-isoprenylcysteine O-methyltransferase Ste14